MPTRITAQEALPNLLVPSWGLQAVRTDGGDACALRAAAERICATSLGSCFGAPVSRALSSALIDALLLPPVGCSQAGLELARQRAAGGLAVVAIGGAAARASHARAGVVLEGRPAMDGMPLRLRDVRLLVLGRTAVPPEEQREEGAAANLTDRLPATL